MAQWVCLSLSSGAEDFSSIPHERLRENNAWVDLVVKIHTTSMDLSLSDALLRNRLNDLLCETGKTTTKNATGKTRIRKST